MTDPVAASGHELAMQAQEEASATENVIEVIKRFLLKSLGWVSIYLVGYYNFSVAWLLTPLLLSVLRSQWKADRDRKLAAAREAALTDEKKMIEARIRVEDLPSWVFFPDKERAEWINSMLQQLWPNVGHYTRKIIAESVEPAVKNALESYSLGGFKFEKVVLGRVPPRITGIKVYEKNIARDEIIMDLDLVFASDCDIKFSVKKIAAKISDFSLRGLLRVVFKPLISEIPLIGGVQVYFLTPPEIDFDLGGVANALDAPGLSNIIRKIILEQIGYFIVLPNKYTMALVENVTNKDLKCPDSAGVLRVNLVKADKLMKKDIGVLGMGKSDPYATLQVGAKKVQTKIINNTISPEWYYMADFPIEVVKGQQLTIEVFDHDDPGDDEFLGRASVATSVVEERGEIRDMWAELEDVPTGKILMSLSWLNATNDKSVLQDIDDGLSKCLLHVFVDSCLELKSPATSNKTSSKPSPIVELRVGQGEPQSTWPQYYDSNPVYEQGFVFTVGNPHVDDLHIQIIDQGHKNANIGTTTIRTSDIMASPDMEYVCQPFHLRGGGGNGVIKLAVNVRCLEKATRKTSTRLTDSIKIPSSKSPSPEPETAPSIDQNSEPKLEKKASTISRKSSKSPPALDEMVSSTIGPMVQTTGNEVNIDTFLNTETELRQRKGKLGKVKLSMKYDRVKEVLKIHVHEATGLPGGNLPDPPDPYVKLYLLPERSKSSKRRSDFKKDTVEPIYDEKFEYKDMNSSRINSQQLEVSVVDRKGIFSKCSTMGRCVVDLVNLTNSDVEEQWFILEEVEQDSD